MAGLLISRLFRYSNILQAVVLTIGTAFCFGIALNQGHINWYLPFISETGAFSPEIGLFSYTLILGSILGLIMILHRYTLIVLTISALNSRERKLNFFACIVGALAMLGLSGVAAFPMSTVFWAHLLCAGVFFGNIFLYVLLTTVYTFQRERLSKLFKFRLLLCILTCTVLVLLIILFPISLKYWHEKNANIPALKEPENEGFAMILICSCFEWLYMILNLAFTVTLLNGLEKADFIIVSYEEEELHQSGNVPAVPPVNQGNDDDLPEIKEEKDNADYFPVQI